MTAFPPAISTRPGLRGHLRLACGCDETARSFLRKQSAAVPVHLSKPFWDQGTLVANVTNPTAGLLAGDFIDVAVSVESGASLLLTTPSATRIHDTQSGEAAVEQFFSVANGGRLEVWPEIVIPQAGARYRQKTRIEIEAGGELLFLEALAPGRVASGEIFAFERLDWETDIFYDGIKIARERYVLSRENGSLHVLQTAFPAAYQASLFIVSGRLSDAAPCWETVRRLHDDNLWLGFSRLSHAGWVIKILARDSLGLRRALEGLRVALHASAGWSAPALRKL